MPKTENVSVGKPKVSGAVFRAALGTAVPTGATTELAEAYKDLGYVSEDGVTNSNSPSSSDLKAWGGTIVYTYQEEKPDTFKLKMIEALNIDVLKTVYGEKNVTGDLETGIKITANATEAEEAVYVIDTILRNGTLKRIVIPDGKITEVGDIVYVDNDVIGYDVTITALPDDDNNTHTEYIIKQAETTADPGTTDPDPSNP